MEGNLMKKIHTRFFSKSWTKVQTSTTLRWWQRGVFWEDAKSLQAADTLAQFSASLKSINGFYAVVKEQQNGLFAAVDHIRSIPLFYGQKEGHIFLSDNAEWVRKSIEDDEVDTLAKEEFQLTGYVTGEETLFPNVKQLQAGECIRIAENGTSATVETERYYLFVHEEPEGCDQEILWKKLDEAVLVSIRNLINYAGGRQIVIPLSGGYDSRLIATMLVKLGYTNVLTFTYGLPGNKESNYSKKVADALGFDWYFIEYNNQMWREVCESQEFLEYQEWASNWSSYSHIQDWPAVRELKRRKIVDKDAIYVPGHSGDFVAGSHIPNEVFKTPFYPEKLQERILLKHYKLAPLGLLSYPQEKWEDRIVGRVRAGATDETWKYVDAYECWNWQERQSKYICNAVRVYEYFGFDWWLPLWDLNFIYFWQKVPLRLRKERFWYMQYVSSCYTSQLKNNQAHLGNAREDFSLRAKQFFSKNKLTKNLYVKLRAQFAKNSHPLAFYGQYDDGEHHELFTKGYNVIGVGVHDFLKRINKH